MSLVRRGGRIVNIASICGFAVLSICGASSVENSPLRRWRQIDDLIRVVTYLFSNIRHVSASGTLL
jgi:hypothetical protein